MADHIVLLAEAAMAHANPPKLQPQAAVQPPPQQQLQHTDTNVLHTLAAAVADNETQFPTAWKNGPVSYMSGATMSVSTTSLVNAINANNATTGKKKRTNLPKESKAVLRTWLKRHFQHPYPAEEDKTALAAAAGITVEQVNNWFINARVREWKPKVQSHAQKYFEELQLAEQDKNGPTATIGKHKAGESKDAGAAQAGGADSTQNDDEIAEPPSKKLRHHSLSREATDLLTAWFLEHRKNPYPTGRSSVQ